MTTLHGSKVVLRAATHDDVDTLVRIRATPEVYARWVEQDVGLLAEVSEDITDPEKVFLAVEYDGEVVGAIQWQSEDDPMYRHASLDVYLDPKVHGHGIGTDAIRTLATHLVDHHGFPRLVIDPAADNIAAIRCYGKIGFRPVGIMRQYERGPDGVFHDGLLMDLLAAELIR
jgi:aminoglycoside 6'-N-acetyltransferase